MKKLMIAAAIVCAAALSQAASVSWASDVIYKPVDAKGTYGTATTDKMGSKAATGYLWEVTKAVWESYAADTSKIYEEFAKEGHGVLGAETKTAQTTLQGKITLAGTTDYAEGASAYGLILYTYNDGTTDWYVANAAKYDGMGTATANVAALNLYEGGKIGTTPQGDAITGWTKVESIPEPTSGLLLLLGVAGLALRRRRA